MVLLDQLYQSNEQYLKNLDIFIAAGQLKLKELQDDILPVAKTKLKIQPIRWMFRNITIWCSLLTGLRKKRMI